jgi:hypothetical protein
VIRAALSFFVSGLVLVLAGFTARQQAENYDRAAELDRLQSEAEWYVRECTELRAELDRYEFESTASQLEAELREGPAEEEKERASVEE